MEELKEAIKEGLRVVVIAVIPVTIDAVMSGAVDLRLIAVTGIVAGLRFLDSWLHKSGVAEKGLTRF